ncbi:MAG TPA: hypothetical protein PLP27_09695 [Crocinitomicaceae bacterium]|nr:hypothetical protein [Crocinitomicaceae bacterium]
MKNLNFLGLAMLFVLLTACDYASLSFKNPQPNDKTSLDKIPLALRGNYIYLGDSSVLAIDKHTIKVIYTEKMKVEEDSNTVASNDTINSDQAEITYSVANVEQYKTSESILFDINNGDVIRHFRGAYFISTSNGSDWDVQRIQKSGRGITIGSCNNKTDLGLLGGITGTEINPNGKTVFDPTKDQLKEFLKQGGFRNISYYAKLKRK